MAKPIPKRLKALRRQEHAVSKKLEAAQQSRVTTQKACGRAYEAYDDAKELVQEIPEELEDIKSQVISPSKFGKEDHE